MKRSEINQIVEDSIDFFNSCPFHLPPFAYWNPSDWNENKDNIRGIIDNCLGWDVTDFGSGDFWSTGLTAFTLRNGNANQDSGAIIPYCEKAMIVHEQQRTPMHHHESKIEDIINRGGGILQVKVFKTKDGKSMSTGGFKITMDGTRRMVHPGEILDIHPGESISLFTDIFHAFWGKIGHGTVLVGEVSSTNNDNIDNIFHENVPRFSHIEEDASPKYLLASDYITHLLV